jgi:hypothetical protein
VALREITALIGRFCCAVVESQCSIHPFSTRFRRFITQEIEPWHENGEIWRRLKIIFPDAVGSHTKQQVTYFGPDGLMRSHDYTVDILGGATNFGLLTPSARHWLLAAQRYCVGRRRDVAEVVLGGVVDTFHDLFGFQYQVL